MTEKHSVMFLKAVEGTLRGCLDNKIGKAYTGTLIICFASGTVTGDGIHNNIT